MQSRNRYLRMGFLRWARAFAPHLTQVLSFYERQEERVKEWLDKVGEESKSNLEELNAIEVLDSGMEAPQLPPELLEANRLTLIGRKYVEVKQTLVHAGIGEDRAETLAEQLFKLAGRQIIDVRGGGGGRNPVIVDTRHNTGGGH